MTIYSKTTHLELLKNVYQFKEIEKCFLNQGYFNLFKSKENENSLELENYSIMMIEHLHWENRAHYFELIETILESSTGLLNFKAKCMAIEKAGQVLQTQLIILEPNIRQDHEIGKEKLNDLLQNIFIQMKDRYPLS